MIRFYPLFSFLLIFHVNSRAQLSEILEKPIYQINGEGFDERVKTDPETAERIYWVIETDRDEKYNQPWKDSVETRLFREQLAFVLSCKRLKELHILVIDEVVHFPDELIRIRELDSLKLLFVHFDLVVTTIGMEVILTDEIEEFSYRPFNLSFLRGMDQLELFSTNWNAEVHDPDALLTLTELKYAQIPVTSLQPDFFRLPHLEYVQCGEQLTLRWNKKDRKRKRRHAEREFLCPSFDEIDHLRQMEMASVKRKKPIDWNEAFLQLNEAGDTLFHLKGSGKQYSIDFLKSSDGCDSHTSAYRLTRQGNEINVNVALNEECYRTSHVEINGNDTLMAIHYSRDHHWKEQETHTQINDHFVNGKRHGNYDLIGNGIIDRRRTYFQDSLIRKFPDDYAQIYMPMYELLKEGNRNVRLFFAGGIVENGEIIRMVWKPSRMNYNPTDYQLSIELKDTVLHGKTWATNNAGDTVLIMHFENGVRNGYSYREYRLDRGRGALCTEKIYYSNGTKTRGTTDDGTYVCTFDHREGVKNIFTRILKSNGMLIQESFYHAETNEKEFLTYDKTTGELVRSSRVKQDR